MSEHHYLLAEIKNEVDLDRTEIYQNEAEQMSNSMNWFVAEYGKTAQVVPLMVHPTRKLADSAYPPTNMVVMTLKELNRLHTQLRALAAILASRVPEAWTVHEVGRLLVDQRLDEGNIRSNYCVPAKRKT